MKITFAAAAWEDYLHWQAEDRKILERLNTLIKDCKRSPFDGIGKPEPRQDLTYEGGHIAAISDLIDCIEKDRQTRCSAADSRAIIEMIAAVFESHRVGGPVELPLKTRVNPLTLL